VSLGDLLSLAQLLQFFSCPCPIKKVCLLSFVCLFCLLSFVLYDLRHGLGGLPDAHECLVAGLVALLAPLDGLQLLGVGHACQLGHRDLAVRNEGVPRHGADGRLALLLGLFLDGSGYGLSHGRSHGRRHDRGHGRHDRDHDLLYRGDRRRLREASRLPRRDEALVAILVLLADGLRLVEHLAVLLEVGEARRLRLLDVLDEGVPRHRAVRGGLLLLLVCDGRCDRRCDGRCDDHGLHRRLGLLGLLDLGHRRSRSRLSARRSDESGQGLLHLLDHRRRLSDHLRDLCEVGDGGHLSFG